MSALAQDRPLIHAQNAGPPFWGCSHYGTQTYIFLSESNIMDWSIPRKLCTVGLIGALVVSLAPWSVCAFSRMSDAQLSSIADTAPGSADTAAVHEADAFATGFLGAIPTCYRRYPIGQASWQWPAILGLLGGVLLFRRLQQAEYVRRVKKASGAHVYAKRTKPTADNPEAPSNGGFIQSRQRNTTAPNRSLDVEDEEKDRW